jgi:hypothetical protein
MKIFCHVPRENWIVDRMGNEFKKYSSHNVSFDKIENDTNIIWLFASWCWNQIPKSVLKEKKVVCTIHHEVPWKFNEERKKNFLIRDQFVDYYLTYTKETADMIFNLTGKQSKIISHWVNNDIWKSLDSIQCRKDLNLPKDKFLIGSFQRDTEGSDLKTPKLEKGPDIFIDKVIEISKFKDIHILLGGWRRQYVINKLLENNIKYTYFELPDNDTVNKMYNSLDLYLISSRCEGGPQSLFEASYLNIPILSTKSGQYELINKKCIYDAKEKITSNKIIEAKNSADENLNRIKNFIIKDHVKVYDKFFMSVL